MKMLRRNPTPEMQPPTLPVFRTERVTYRPAAKLCTDTGPRLPRKAGMAKLSPEQVLLVKQLRPERRPYRAKALALGQLLGLGRGTIEDIWNNRSWGWVGRDWKTLKKAPQSPAAAFRSQGR